MSIINLHIMLGSGRITAPSDVKKCLTLAASAAFSVSATVWWELFTICPIRRGLSADDRA